MLQVVATKPQDLQITKCIRWEQGILIFHSKRLGLSLLLAVHQSFASSPGVPQSSSLQTGAFQIANTVNESGLGTPIILPCFFIGIIWELLDQMNGWCLDFSQTLRRELRLGSITIMMGEWQFCLPLQYVRMQAKKGMELEEFNSQKK